MMLIWEGMRLGRVGVVPIYIRAREDQGKTWLSCGSLGRPVAPTDGPTGRRWDLNGMEHVSEDSHATLYIYMYSQ
jgi:hypothetical protein